MNIKDMRVRVENDSQMRIAMTILSEVTGMPIGAGLTAKEYVETFGEGVSSIGCSGYAVSGYSAESNFSYEDFLREVASLPKEEQLYIGEYLVEFKDKGVQVGCKFVPVEVVDKIHARLHK